MAVRIDHRADQLEASIVGWAPDRVFADANVVHEAVTAPALG